MSGDLRPVRVRLAPVQPAAPRHGDGRRRAAGCRWSLRSLVTLPYLLGIALLGVVVFGVLGFLFLIAWVV